MSRIILVATAVLLSGCMSQILLDGSPTGTPNIADVPVERRVRAVASSACTARAPLLPYELLEPSGQGWVRRCAHVEGFAYRQGWDYLLQVAEYPGQDRSSPGRLVLRRVVEESPHTHE